MTSERPAQPSTPNLSNGQEDLRSFGELLARTDIVYHGIGADLMALYGVATHGLSSASRQIELTGSVNSNSPRDAAWNSDDRVSVATTPQPGLPNEAFMEYIEHRPITFAINSNVCVPSQPAGRGFYDEAFIEGAPDEAIVGIVLDADTINSPITEMPIVGPLMAAEKARGFMNFLIENYDASLEVTMPELENLIDGIEYSSSPFVGNNDSIISSADEDSVERITSFLQTQLKVALQTKFGRGDLTTVLDMVRSAFPSKSLYINNHEIGIEPIDEYTYFDTLPMDTTIGYEKFDGGSQQPSLYKVRRTIAAQRGRFSQD